MDGLIAVVLGAILGGAARYFVSGVVARRVGETFPWGTLIINVSGALVIGICGGVGEAHQFDPREARCLAVRGDRRPRLLHHCLLLQPADADAGDERPVVALARLY